MSWQARGYHPNSRRALKLRHKQLQNADLGSFGNTRIGMVRKFARNRKVLDLGCVAHDFRIASGPRKMWLHDHVVDAAAECVGVDYDEVGIKQMREAGYDVIHCDITGDLTPILERGPFDVVIAGEIIEHLPSPQSVLSMASEVLRPGGKLVVTSPNPYSLRRQRAGALGITWENVDHVVYVFPSGMAEMGRRTGLVLRRYGTVGWPAPKPLRKELKESLGPLWRAWRASRRGKRKRLSAERRALPTPTFWLSPVDVLLGRLRGRRDMLRETAVYVFQKPRRRREAS